MAQMKIVGREINPRTGKPVPLVDNFVAKEKPPSDATENGGAEKNIHLDYTRKNRRLSR